MNTKIGTGAVTLIALMFALPAAALTVGAEGSGGAGAGVKNAGISVDASSTVSAYNASSATTTSSEGVDASLSADDSTSVGIIFLSRGDVKAPVSGSAEVQFKGSASDVRSKNDLTAYIGAQMEADANVDSVQTSEDNVVVTYKQHAKFLGLIPTTVSATAMVDGSGNVVVTYPWYSFLFSTNRESLESKISARVQANATVHANGQLTADEQALLVAEVRAALEEELTASVGSESSAGVQ